ncbi:DUF4199 domain-containing protein [Chitinophaga lutea]
MKRNTLIFGVIAGLLLVGFMIYSTYQCYNNPDFDPNTAMGYAGMLVVFSLVFVGIKNHRDRYNGGVITFGQAFKTGFFIALIASTMYVGVWLIEYYLFIPDFLDTYTEHRLRVAGKHGATAAELQAIRDEMVQFKGMYKNPLMVILITYFEVLPLGTAVALISALILKKKKPAAAAA